MKYAVDKIINNIALLENINTGEKYEIDVNILPFSIYEGTILTFKNGIYYLEKKDEDKRRKMIEERFRRLRDSG